MNLLEHVHAAIVKIDETNVERGNDLLELSVMFNID